MNKFAHIELDEKSLANRTIQYILKIQNTYLECILYHLILDPREKYGDLIDHVDLINNRLSHLKFFVDYTNVTFENSVFSFTQYKHDQDGSLVDDSLSLAFLRLKIEEFCKEVFWANKNEEMIFKKLSSFESFEEKHIPQKKMHSAFAKADFFNVNGWIKYYEDLLDIKFLDFDEKIIVGKRIIKYKVFNGNYFLGIETDYQNCKNNFKKGVWQEPDYKLIIFKKISEKKIDVAVIFEKFVHPFFSPPIFSFERYFFVKNTIKVSEQQLSALYFVQREYYDDGTVRLFMPEEFGEHLKRHAFFYYDVLYHTTNEYIKFIEESFEPDEDE